MPASLPAFPPLQVATLDSVVLYDTQGALPLAVLGPVVSYIATTFLGMHVYGEVLAHNPVAEGVGTVSIIVINLACFMLLTLVADALSPRFGGAFSPDPTFRLVAYSSIPIWLSGFFAQVPYIAFAVASVTGLYALLKKKRIAEMTNDSITYYSFRINQLYCKI